jgi:3-phosphoshikimate 1-carboxyvinyltransferase
MVTEAVTEAVRFHAPPSKSVSHRYLIGAALAGGESELAHVLDSRDVERTRSILAAGGAVFTDLGNGGWRVRGVGGRLRGAAPGEEPLSCDVHESGTTCRLLAAVLASGEGLFRLHGAPRMRERPMGALTSALGGLGAVFRFEEKDGHLPFVLEAAGLEGGETGIDLEESSQYLSGLLLAAPQARAPLTVTIAGRHVVSWPYVGLTLQTLRDFRVNFEVGTRASAEEDWQPADWREPDTVRPGLARFRVWPGAWRAGKYEVEGDWSGAAFLLAAGAMGRRPVRVTGLRADSLQGDRAFASLLSSMGALVENGRDGSVTVSPGPLRGVDVNMASCPDLVPVLAVLAAAAQGDTRIRGVPHLRFKESDRIAAAATELRKAGVAAEEYADGLLVRGQGQAFDVRGKTLSLSAWGDHRMAMSLALLECRGADLRLDDPLVVGKSFPQFWDMWRKVRA